MLVAGLRMRRSAFFLLTSAFLLSSLGYFENLDLLGDAAE
jgi:hypothetical protein